MLAGYPMVDFRVELFDGSYHTVDSNEMSFKMAGIQAFKTVAPKCRPVLLEPLDEVEIVTPDEYLGDVLGDISSRRGQILGTDPRRRLRGHARPRGRAAVGAASVCERPAVDDARPRAPPARVHGYEQMPGEAAQRVITRQQKDAGEGAGALP